MIASDAIEAEKAAIAERREQRQRAIDERNNAMAKIEFGMDGTILGANPVFLSLMGFTLDEIKGKHHSMFVETAYRNSPDYRAFWDKLGRGEVDAGRFKRIGKGGKEVWIEGSYNAAVRSERQALQGGQICHRYHRRR